MFFFANHRGIVPHSHQRSIRCFFFSYSWFVCRVFCQECDEILNASNFRSVSFNQFCLFFLVIRCGRFERKSVILLKRGVPVGQSKMRSNNFASSLFYHRAAISKKKRKKIEWHENFLCDSWRSHVIYDSPPRG